VVRAVLFDLDDTIFDHRETSRRALSRCARPSRCCASSRSTSSSSGNARVLEQLHQGVMQGFVSVDAAREDAFASLAPGGDEATTPSRGGGVAVPPTYLAERCLVPAAELCGRSSRSRRSASSRTTFSRSRKTSSQFGCDRSSTSCLSAEKAWRTGPRHLPEDAGASRLRGAEAVMVGTRGRPTSSGRRRPDSRHLVQTGAACLAGPGPGSEIRSLSLPIRSSGTSSRYDRRRPYEQCLALHRLHFASRSPPTTCFRSSPWGSRCSSSSGRRWR